MEFFTATELRENLEGDTGWLWDGILPETGLSIAVSLPKVGKSTFCWGLAAAVSTSNSFLGRECLEGEVLYVSTEGSSTYLANVFDSLPQSEQLHVHVGSTWGDSIQQLDDAIVAYEPRLVILDTLFRYLGVADINDYSQVTGSLGRLEDLARRHRTHILGTHHTARRSRESKTSPGDQILGSTAIFGLADAVLLIEDRRGQRILSSEQRIGDNLKPHVLKLGTTNLPTELVALD
jgi:RecA-family ATPase